MNLAHVIENGCQHHPDVPVPCCMCHGLELAERDRGRRPSKQDQKSTWRDRSIVSKDRLDAERAVSIMSSDSVNEWGRRKSEILYG